MRTSFYQRIREFRGTEKRTSAAKAGYGNVIYGTAEPVPFQDRVLTHALKPLRATRNNNFFRSLFSSGGADRCQPRTLIRGDHVTGFQAISTFKTNFETSGTAYETVNSATAFVRPLILFRSANGYPDRGANVFRIAAIGMLSLHLLSQFDWSLCSNRKAQKP